MLAVAHGEWKMMKLFMPHHRNLYGSGSRVTRRSRRTVYGAGERCLLVQGDGFPHPPIADGRRIPLAMSPCDKCFIAMSRLCAICRQQEQVTSNREVIVTC